MRNSWTAAALLAALAAGASAPAAAAVAAGVPASGALAFTVLRNGDEVGSHVIRFDQGADGLGVTVETDVNVKLPFLGVSVYRFRHSGQERWHDGVLAELSSTTDDDGTEHRLAVRRDGDALAVKSDVTEYSGEVGLVPASLWNASLVRQKVLLNTLDGREMPISVVEAGTDEVDVKGNAVKARHYVLSGGLERELWYDPDGVLVKVRFRGKDDSEIEYVLR